MLSNIHLLLIGAIALVNAIETIEVSDDEVAQWSELCRPPDVPQLDKRAVVRDRALIWDKGIIPYKFKEKEFNEGQIQAIKYAMELWMAESCIQFVPHTNEKDYIMFVNYGHYCYSGVGKQGGQQLVNAGSICIDNIGALIHELGHTLGLWHEHTRPDRDEYMEIFYDNIIPYYKHLFNIQPRSEVQSFCQPYDYESIMQYSLNAFAINASEPTMVPKKNYTGEVAIGQGEAPSKGDYQQLRYLYGCEKFSTNCTEMGIDGKEYSPVFLNGSHGNWKNEKTSSVTATTITEIFLTGSVPVIDAPITTSKTFTIIPETVTTPIPITLDIKSSSSSLLETSTTLDATPVPTHTSLDKEIAATPVSDENIIEGKKLGLKIYDPSLDSSYWMKCEEKCKRTKCPNDTFPSRLHVLCYTSILVFEKVTSHAKDKYIYVNDTVTLKPCVILNGTINCNTEKYIGCGKGKCAPCLPNSTKKSVVCSNSEWQILCKIKKRGEALKHNDLIEFKLKKDNRHIYCEKSEKKKKRCHLNGISSQFYVHQIK